MIVVFMKSSRGAHGALVLGLVREHLVHYNA